MKTVAIIGCGAAGSAAAIALGRASKDFTVTVYERLAKPLKKLLATGNGRCNLTNERLSQSDYFGDTAFAESVLKTYPPQSTVDFFASMGLLCKTEAEGRVYPVSGQASSVRETLLAEMQRLGIAIETEREITKVQPQKNGFLLNGQYFADFLALCAGGCAAPQHGTDGGAFRLLRQLGHTVVPPAPALTALVAKRFPKSLKGVRCVCRATLECKGKKLYNIDGEVQFTEYGLSGIPIMQLSRLVSVAPQERFSVKLDCLPQVSETQLLLFLHNAKKSAPQKTAGTLAQGILPKALGDTLLLSCGIHKDEPCGKLTEAQIARFVGTVKCYTVEIDRPRGFDFAQVTAGGADVSEFDPMTMQSKKWPHLYVCGETLNIDGGCGGYNLQWAWSSGRAAGEAIAKEYAD